MVLRLLGNPHFQSYTRCSDELESLPTQELCPGCLWCVYKPVQPNLGERSQCDPHEVAKWEQEDEEPSVSHLRQSPWNKEQVWH